MQHRSRRSFLALAGMAAGTDPPRRQPARPFRSLRAGARAAFFSDEILNPVEVSGAAAEPTIGRLPGERRMYVMNITQGEHHLIGSQVMSRVARPVETGGVHELMVFAGRSGAAMPRHVHRSSHAAILVLGGEMEIEVNGRRWRMMRGDFANLPPGTPHAWSMRSDRGQIALFTMNDRVGAAFVAMGVPHPSSEVPAGNQGNLAREARAGVIRG